MATEGRATNFGVFYRFDQRRFLRDFYKALKTERMSKRCKGKVAGVQLWKAFLRREGHGR